MCINANTRDFPDLYEAACRMARCQWATMMAIHPETCRRMVHTAVKSDCPIVFPGTYFQTFALSEDLSVPCHYDKNDAEEALLAVFHIPKAGATEIDINDSSSFVFPEHSVAIKPSPASFILFSGNSMQHCSTKMKEDKSVTRIGAGAQMRDGTIKAMEKKGYIHQYLPTDEEMKKLDDSLLLQVALQCGAYNNASMSKSSPDVKGNIGTMGTYFAGYTRPMVEKSIRWLRNRHRLRMTPEIQKRISDAGLRVTVTLRSGKVAEGVLLRETQASVQLTDASIDGKKTSADRIIIMSGSFLFMDFNDADQTVDAKLFQKHERLPNLLPENPRLKKKAGPSLSTREWRSIETAALSDNTTCRRRTTPTLLEQIGSQNPTKSHKSEMGQSCFGTQKPEYSSV